MKASLYESSGGRPEVYGFVSGLGGRDIIPEYIEEMIEKVENSEKEKLHRVNWLGLKK